MVNDPTPINVHRKPKDNIETVLISLGGIISSGMSRYDHVSLTSDRNVTYEVVISNPKLLDIYLGEILRSCKVDDYKTYLDNLVRRSLRKKFTLFLPAAFSFAKIGDDALVVLEEVIQIGVGINYQLENLPILSALKTEQSIGQSSIKGIIVYGNKRMVDGYNTHRLPTELIKTIS